MKNSDPDGNAKRRARKGDRRCGACRYYFRAQRVSVEDVVVGGG